MKDSKALAYVNFYAAMGTLRAFCEIDAEAAKLAGQQDMAVRFKVKGGPDGVLQFKGGKVEAIPYAAGVHYDIGLSCKDCDMFNKLVAGEKVTPIPIKGLTKLKFVLDPASPFNVLTGKMSELMRKQDGFANDEEKTLATVLTFNAMAAAIAQIGNNDPIGQVARKNWADGDVSMEIPGVTTLCIRKKDGVLTFIPAASPAPRAIFSFRSVNVAKDVIDGKLDAMTAVGTGDIAMKGMGFMLDNLNKCLNLVPQYLA